MIIGMALFKWGVISNKRSTRFYKYVLVGVGGIGFALVLTGVWAREAFAWETIPVLTLAFQFNYWGAPLLATGYLAGNYATVPVGPRRIVVHALTAVGRTAFSNYLLQTVLATTIFYGHGTRVVRAVEPCGVTRSGRGDLGDPNPTFNVVVGTVPVRTG